MYSIPKKLKSVEHGSQAFDQFYFGLFFKKYSHQELEFYSRFLQGWIRFLDRYLPLEHGREKDVLEIGCGIGSFACILHERGFNVHATDISKFIVDRAQSLQPEVKFSVLDIENKPKWNKHYDYIFALEVIEHLKNPMKVFRTLRQGLNSNGVLVISTPLPTPLVLSDPMHINVHAPKYWGSLAEQAGYTILLCKAVSFVPFLYRFHKMLSMPLPFVATLPWINTTCFLILRK